MSDSFEMSPEQLLKAAENINNHYEKLIAHLSRLDYNLDETFGTHWKGRAQESFVAPWKAWFEAAKNTTAILGIMANNITEFTTAAIQETTLEATTITESFDNTVQW